jgi:hypothetical protein
MIHSSHPSGCRCPICYENMFCEIAEPTDKLQKLALAAVHSSALIARIERAHDLHAVFTIKDSQEFIEAKAAVETALK